MRLFGSLGSWDACRESLTQTAILRSRKPLILLVRSEKCVLAIRPDSYVALLVSENSASTFTMENEAIQDFLAEQRESGSEDVSMAFLNFEDAWERKLWHQLTEQLLDYFENPSSEANRLTTYQKFILSFADKINQLSLVTLGLKASKQCKGKLFFQNIANPLLTALVDDHERLAFLNTLANRVNKPASQDAYVYAIIEVASVTLRIGDADGARKDLDTAEKILDGFDSVEAVVHAAFYGTNATYYQVYYSMVPPSWLHADRPQTKLEFASYYRNALLYLACIDISSIDSQSQHTLACDLAVSALVSDSIYNFGELLLHPILDSLKSSSDAWLRELLFAFNRGDLAAYDVLSNNISKKPLLEEHKFFLYQKISLSALTELVFRRPPHDRAMTFATISQETKVQPNEIEHLIMKALSLGLLRGSIDQVDEVARINWVQPKVLEKEQVNGMRMRLREWDSSVNQLGHWIEGVGKDVWAA